MRGFLAFRAQSEGQFGESAFKTPHFVHPEAKSPSLCAPAAQAWLFVAVRLHLQLLANTLQALLELAIHPRYPSSALAQAPSLKPGMAKSSPMSSGRLTSMPSVASSS